MQIQILVQMPVLCVLTIKLSSAGSSVYGGPPSSLSREGPQFLSSLIDYSIDCLFSNLLYVTKMNSQKLPKSSINADEFFVAYPATLAAKRERLIIFRCVVGKKRVAKKKYLQQTELSVFPHKAFLSNFCHWLYFN